LKELGYDRTLHSCTSYWERHVKAEIAGERVANTWSDGERHILVTLTQKQVDLEEKDKTSIITWKQHWENVFQHLKNAGSDKSVVCFAIVLFSLSIRVRELRE
jgi:hypothetical protein